MADGLSGTIDTWSTENGKVRQSIDLGTFKQQTIIADHHGWSTQLSGQFEVLTEAETQDAMHDADLLFDDILHGRDGAVVSLGSREMSGGKTVDVLKISFGASNAYDYELSPGSRSSNHSRKRSVSEHRRRY